MANAKISSLPVATTLAAGDVFPIVQSGTNKKVSLGTIRTNILTNQVPTTPTSAGTVGTIAFDANFVYVCVATNTWKRSPLSSW